MKLTIEKLRHVVHVADPHHLQQFESAVAIANEIILIGSASRGRLSPNSDLDILFVGNGERFKTPRLDFIWISPKEIRTEEWLGSELATHAATYGVWLKGKGSWRKRTFFSELAVTRKCERILIRLSRIYLKRRALSRRSVRELLVRSVLDMQRAVLLAEKKPVPPTCDLITVFLADPERTYRRVCGARLLGELGRYFVTKFIPRKDVARYLVRKARAYEKELSYPISNIQSKLP